MLPLRFHLGLAAFQTLFRLRRRIAGRQLALQLLGLEQFLLLILQLLRQPLLLTFQRRRAVFITVQQPFQSGQDAGDIIGWTGQQPRQFGIVSRLDPPHRLFQLPLQALQFLFQQPGLVKQLVLNQQKLLGAKNLAENIFAFAGAGGDQLAKLTLRHHHNLAELLIRQAERLDNLRVDCRRFADADATRNHFFKLGVMLAFRQTAAPLLRP